MIKLINLVNLLNSLPRSVVFLLLEVIEELSCSGASRIVNIVNKNSTLGIINFIEVKIILIKLNLVEYLPHQ
jgi:hypothetical protein